VRPRHRNIRIFTSIFFVNSRIMKGILDCLLLIISFLSEHYRKRMHHFLLAKFVVLPCLWKRYLTLFLLVRRVTVSDKWFVVDDSFFLFFSLSYPKRCTLALFVFGILIPVIFLLIFYFCPWPFYKSFICFQFNPSITIFHIHLSHLYFWCFNSSLFLFLILFSLAFL
jgi:hypothetical protein